MQFGRYKVIEQLGAGAMGEVFKATDTHVHDRIVAVKVLIGRLSRNENAVKRFETEVKTAATLNHPNIIAIQDRGEAEDGRPFFVMEYLEGDDLKLYTSGQAELPLDRRIELGSQVADALDFAHERGVVHRDVKPSNIFVVCHGEQLQAKLLDFGIVHVEGSDLTQTTDQPGTYNYMAPEVLRGAEATIQSDLFSLGIVLYELFTFMHPFQAPTEPLIHSRIMHEAPDRPRKASPDIPNQLEAMILQLLEKEPDERPPRAKEIAEALRGMVASLRSTGVSGTPSDFSSADEMTGQAIRSFIERARRFETEGNLEEALKLRSQALALAPDNSKLKRKVESLSHKIQRRSRIESLLSAAREALEAGDLGGSRAAFEDAWVITHDDARVLDFKSRLELAEAQRGNASVEPVNEEPVAEPEPEPLPVQDAQSPVEVPAAELHPDLVRALDLHFRGAGKAECRKLLTGYLRKNPGDANAVQALGDILAGRTPAITGYEPPPPWTPEERKTLEELTERIEKVVAVAGEQSTEFRARAVALKTELDQLGRGLANSARLTEIERDVNQASKQVVGVVKDQIEKLGEQLKDALRIGGVAIVPEHRTGAESLIDKLKAVDEQQAIGSGAALVAEAGEAKDKLDEVIRATHSELSQQVGRMSGKRADELGRRLGAWSPDSGVPLGKLVEDTSEVIASEIDTWSERVEDTRAIDEQALHRLVAVASELRDAEPGRAVSNSRVGVDAIEALRAAHAAYLKVLGGEQKRIGPEFERLADELGPEESQAIRSFLGESLPVRLSEARRLVETVQGMLEAAGRERNRRLEAQTAEAKSCLDTPWLEAEVATIDRATTECEVLLASARTARDARAKLRRVIQSEGGSRSEVDGLIAEARSAAAASQEVHEQAQRDWSDRLQALRADLSQLTDGGMPERVRKRATRIKLPDSPAVGPSDIRTFVQTASHGSAELETLLEKVSKLVPSKRREAERLLESLQRKSRGLRFPRISRELRGRIEDGREQLEKLLDEQELTLAEIVPAVKHAKSVVRQIPFNALPWLGLVLLVSVVSAGVWFVVAPRELQVEAGLAADEIKLANSDGEEVLSRSKADGKWTFRVPPGKYQIWHVRPDKTESDKQDVDVLLRQLPAPLATISEPQGDSYQDNMKTLLKKRFPDLFEQ